MARRSFRSQAAVNPFENIGLDRRLVEALVQAGDESMLVALSGLRKSVVKALHPDIVGSSAGNNFLDSFLTDTQRIVDMPPSDRNILAQAFVAAKVTRTRAKTPEFKSVDFHDGTLLEEIGEMVLRSGESIPTAKNSRILVRPLNFSLKKPEKFDGEAYEWYPPETAGIYILDVPESGKINWLTAKQASLATLLKHGDHYRIKLDEDREKIPAQIKAETNLIKCALLDNMQLDIADIECSDTDDSIIVDKNNSKLYLKQSSNSLELGEVPVRPIVDKYLSDGIYKLKLSKNPQGETVCDLADTVYIHNGIPAKETQFLIAGTVSKDFIDMEEKRFFQEAYGGIKPVALPARSMLSSELKTYQINTKLLKHAQKFYSPNVNDKGHFIIGMNESEAISILGSTISLTKRQS